MAFVIPFLGQDFPGKLSHLARTLRANLAYVAATYSPSVACIILVDFGTPFDLQGFDGTTLMTIVEEHRNFMQDGRLKVYIAAERQTRVNHTRFTNTALRLAVGHGYDWVQPLHFYELLRGTDPFAQPRNLLEDVASKQDQANRGIIMLTETATGQSRLSTWAFVWADVGYFPEQGNFGSVLPIETFCTMLMLEHGVHPIDRDLPRWNTEISMISLSQHLKRTDILPADVLETARLTEVDWDAWYMAWHSGGVKVGVQVRRLFPDRGPGNTLRFSDPTELSVICYIEPLPPAVAPCSCPGFTSTTETDVRPARGGGRHDRSLQLATGIPVQTAVPPVILPAVPGFLGLPADRSAQAVA